LLASLPPNYTKYKAYQGKGLAEIAEMARGDGLPPMSPGTVEVYAHHLSALFNYAIQKGVVETNPAARLSTGAHRPASSRVPFNVEELNSLWSNLPGWSGGGKTGRHWVPLIGCWSGMRLGEIVWLSVADIQNVDGVDAFLLTPQDDRRLKTRGAQRIVPIHKELKRLGLMKHVEAIRERNGVRLFPDLPGEDQTHCVDMFQKRFSYMLRGKVEVRRGVSFHSFRHGFRDALREAGSTIDVTRALGGWARAGGIEERYGQGTRPRTLSIWMDKIDFPGVSISHLFSR
jgi:integrase